MARRFSPANLKAYIDLEQVTLYRLEDETRRMGHVIDRGTLTRYLSGENEPSCRSLATLADYFQTTIDALFEDA